MAQNRSFQLAFIRIGINRSTPKRQNAASPPFVGSASEKVNAAIMKNNMKIFFMVGASLFQSDFVVWGPARLPFRFVRQFYCSIS